jgi:hypothetical protein
MDVKIITIAVDVKFPALAGCRRKAAGRFEFQV